MAKNIPPQDGAPGDDDTYFYEKFDDKKRDAETEKNIKKARESGAQADAKNAAKKPTKKKAKPKTRALAKPSDDDDAGPPLAITRLTVMQQKFVYYFTKHGNATRAAKQAGYLGDRNTLAVLGSQNLRRPKIAAALAEEMTEYGMSEREYLIRVAQRARSSMEPFFGGDTDDPNAANLPGEPPKVDLTTEEARENLCNIKKLKTHSSTTIKEDDATEHLSVEIEVYDALPALKMVGDMIGLTGRGKKPQGPPKQNETPPGAAPPIAAETPEQTRARLAKMLGLPVEMLPPVPPR